MSKHSSHVPTARASLALQALQNLRLVFGSARSHDAQVRRSERISGSQLWALSEIAQSDGMSVNSLAECMALHQTTASNLLKTLMARRLVRRVRDPRDHRVVQLHVSAEGMRLLQKAPPPAAGLLVDALRALDSKQLAKLNSMLIILLRRMRDTAPAAAGQTLLGE
ncbi:MAG TPA: MarR family transcriptional regulator [Steroidobacteraceae bacterium]|jgi:DNA-binding MarR family transcriptional regulator